MNRSKKATNVVVCFILVIAGLSAFTFWVISPLPAHAIAALSKDATAGMAEATCQIDSHVVQDALLGALPTLIAAAFFGAMQRASHGQPCAIGSVASDRRHKNSAAKGLVDRDAQSLQHWCWLAAWCASRSSNPTPSIHQ